MDRAAIDKMNFKQLKDAAANLDLSVSGSRVDYIDALVTYYERRDFATGAGPSRQEESPRQDAQPPTASDSSQQMMTTLTQFMTSMANQMQQQQLMQQMLSVMATRNDGTTSVHSGPSNSSIPEPNQEVPRQSSIGSSSAAHAVNLLAPQIPEFGGTDTENVRLWVQRIDRVSAIHRAPDHVTLLAASSRLVKQARKWFDLGSGPMLESWMGFREAIIKRFERRVLFQVALQKIEARKWNPSRESFQEYAMDRLTLMHSLDLSAKDSIHLLTGGIGNQALRATAAALRVETIDEFLDGMHNITAVTTENFKGQFSNQRTLNTEEQRSNGGGKVGHLAKHCRTAGTFCVYCRSQGHLRNDCPKLKRKEQQGCTSQPTAAGAVSTVQAAQDPSNTIALVRESGEIIKINGSPLKIVKFNGSDCNLFALLDTGSPVSFVRSDIYNMFFTRSAESLNPPNIMYRAVNNTPIQIYGSKEISISLEQIPAVEFKVDLHVLQDTSLATEIILGRDFLDKHNISATYRPNGFEDENDNIQLFPDSLLRLLAYSETDNSSSVENQIKDISIDFDKQVKQQLRDLLMEIEKSSVPRVDDDYCVTVHLKDESPYRYAPRKFALAEQIEIRKITDDLLARGIIKESISPFCARVVPIKKKNGSTRLCVDLRPLNNKTLGTASTLLRYTQTIQNILHLPHPMGNSIQRFLGLTGYFRKFIKDYSRRTKPLHNLLKKSVAFDFNDACVKAFEGLKDELCSRPVLSIYNPTAETQLHTDACSQGLGAILFQKASNGNQLPVAYFSQMTNDAETRYHSFELEMLAIVKAIERFHIYLYGIEFTIVTDYNALVYAVNKANLNPRIAQWTLSFQNYRFKLIHRSGKQMPHVDALSRQIAYIDSLPLERELEYKQFDKFQLIEGLVYKKDGDRSRFVIPESMLNSVLKTYHDDMAHCGVEKTSQGINENYWFPSMRKKVRDYVDNCITCLISNTAINTREGEMQIISPSTVPCDTLDTQSRPGENRKLKPNYKGPYVIAKALDKNRYVVKDIPGFNVTAKPYNSILSPDRIKPWIRPVSPP
ncbi:uncharacterized protein LOC113563025 [Ooceraea biroi]|uniref:uncharacterized protein LOC113563025 n=1 Tax=Ooceraea biroi TaxID=2015173 RepID=UPI000F07FAC2|nr:uncharacterized protein LOC113563025 [Ooceraea biroi]